MRMIATTMKIMIKSPKNHTSNKRATSASGCDDDNDNDDGDNDDDDNDDGVQEESYLKEQSLPHRWLYGNLNLWPRHFPSSILNDVSLILVVRIISDQNLSYPIQIVEIIIGKKRNQSDITSAILSF